MAPAAYQLQQAHLWLWLLEDLMLCAAAPEESSELSLDFTVQSCHWLAFNRALQLEDVTADGEDEHMRLSDLSGRRIINVNIAIASIL